MKTNRQCLACELSTGDRAPGGRIHTTGYWTVEHCVGPLGTGTLIVKPSRHCVHLSELSLEEASELGLLLRRASACVQELTEAEQVYVCLWSHKDGVPGHIHFVVQPSWSRLATEYGGLGPYLQAEQFRRNQLPRESDVVAFCERARAWPGWSDAATVSNDSR